MDKHLDNPIFLDVEASSLGVASYPIEVAWSMPDGTIESHLVRPVAVWTDWSDVAERDVHGITRELLAAEGEPPAVVAARMNTVLSGRTAASDAPDFDDRWLSRMFSAAGVERAFRVGSFADVLERAAGNAGEVWIRSAQLEARARVPRQHRAAWDVAFLLEWWRIVRAACRVSSIAPDAGAVGSVHSEGGHTMIRVTGGFDVKLAPQPPADHEEPTVGRMTLDKQYHGGLEATSKGQMLSTMSAGVEGSGAYVAIEKVTGTLEGKSGTFFLYHTGTMRRGEPGLAIHVVPDSGTDELVGLTGALSIQIEGGLHSYVFDYAFDV